MTQPGNFDCRPEKPQWKHPVSLRELFIVMTVVACGLGFMLACTWEFNERWMLGLAFGSALVGMLMARCFGRSGWISGLAMGAIGGTTSQGMQLFQEASAVAGNVLWPWLSISAAIGLAIALATCLVYRGAMWVSDGSKTGFVAVSRRRPVLAGVMLLSIAMVLGAAWNIDRIVFPGSLAPDYVIRPIVNGRSIDQFEGILTISHHGSWICLGAMFEGRNGDMLDQTFFFHLEDRARQTALAALGDFSQPGRMFVAHFNCDDNRFGYTVGRRLRVVDPDQDRELAAIDAIKGDESSGETRRISWLPGSRVAISRDIYRKSFLSLFDLSNGGQEIRNEFGEVEYAFDARLNHEYRRENDQVSVYELASGNKLTQCEYQTFLSGFKCSPDGKFSIAEFGEIRDEGRQSYLEIGNEFCTFTRSGHAIGWERTLALEDGGPNDDYGWRSRKWERRVPFWMRIRKWCWRDRLILVDPTTSRRELCMLPVDNSVTEVVVSHDGSTVAALTESAIYVYRLPEKFW
jgi:hypothetical protein